MADNQKGFDSRDQDKAKDSTQKGGQTRNPELGRETHAEPGRQAGEARPDNKGAQGYENRQRSQDEGASQRQGSESTSSGGDQWSSEGSSYENRQRSQDEGASQRQGSDSTSSSGDRWSSEGSSQEPSRAVPYAQSTRKGDAEEKRQDR